MSRFARVRKFRILSMVVLAFLWVLAQAGYCDDVLTGTSQPTTKDTVLLIVVGEKNSPYPCTFQDNGGFDVNGVWTLDGSEIVCWLFQYQTVEIENGNTISIENLSTEQKAKLK